MNNIFAFANQKGGVGKTTSCVNTAASLAASNKRILLIDLDPQGNATMGSGIDKNQLEYSVNDILRHQANFEQTVQRGCSAGYDVLPSNSDLTSAEASLVKDVGAEQRLKKALEPVHQDYDYILIDCPPALNMLTVNALAAANWVIIPMQCEYYALEGLTDLIGTIRDAQQTINNKLAIGGIIRTMFDPRNRLGLEVSGQLIEHFGNKVFQTVIPRNVRLAEAPSHGLPVLLYDKGSRGASAYMALAAEFNRRFEHQRQAQDALV